MALAAMCCTAVPVGAQSTPAEMGGEAVERLVEDVEPLAVSLRDPNIGLDSITGGQRIWRWTRGDGEDRFFFIDGGLVAEFGRSEYRAFQVSRTRFVVGQVAGPGTVFHIGMPTELLDSMSGGEEPEPPQGAIVNRVANPPKLLRPVRLIPADTHTGVGASAVDSYQWMDDTWVKYLESRVYQRAAVAEAIDDAVGREPG